MRQSTENTFSPVKRLSEALSSAEAVLIGAGAGLSTAAGFTYSGERFERYFSDFHFDEIKERSICINADIGKVLEEMRAPVNSSTCF